MKFTKIIISCVLLAIGGCSFYRAPVPSADYYYMNPNANFSEIARVALIELENNSVYPQISPDVTRAIYEQLQKKQRFSLTIVKQNDPRWRSLQLDLNSQCDPKKLLLAAKTLGCDAIMTGTVTEYVPHPHMALGLKLKMISCRDGELLWAFEQVWDTADKKTQYRIKKYLENMTGTGSNSLSRRLVTLSSLKFFKFIAYEVAQTF